MKAGLMCAMGIALLAGCKTPPQPNTVCVCVEEAAEADPQVGEQLRSAIAECASSRGYQPAETGAAAFEVWFSATAKEKARLADWVVMEGTAKAYLSVWTPDDYRHYERSFTAVGDRKTDREAAIRAMVAPLSNQVFDWAEATARKGE